ncbi:diphthamide biosynthesis enzyme Dph2 [Candidatus Bathyarchaeota archaeon]|nr:diphthamide biosynthesis enzyme Dph2 [Candidatus Bathyarchaeota archaeon]MBS7613566.1 diphthamide biosynthesis enzyme Dph2 [Candidatus Bathyarchaeota archaeon]MBS7618617.1 diphthamide biosynthesis enzyme Dph2 [Candidatus Bathyarchaeota archaeon]
MFIFLHLRIEEEAIQREVISRGFKRVLIQTPEGLRPYIKELIEKLRKSGVTVLLSGNPCFGACNIALTEAEKLRADAIIHIGHSLMVSCGNTPVLYFDAMYTFPFEECLRKAEEQIKKAGRTVALFSNLQFVECLEAIRSILENWGLEVYIGRGTGVKYPGQVLGCNYTVPLNVESYVDFFLFVGDGSFHPLGLALLTNKRVLALNPVTCSLKDMSELKRRYLRRIYASIVKAREGKVFGVLVGLEPGQFRLELAEGVKKLIEATSREAYLIGFTHLDTGFLEAYTWIDVFVNTACPRLSIEDSERIAKPILNPAELLVALGLTSWEEYVGEYSET